MVGTAWDWRTLDRRLIELHRDWSSKTPFRYVIIDDFLPRDFAEELLAAYPEPDLGGWNHTPYLHQRRKFTLNSGFPLVVGRYFDLLAEPGFRQRMTAITGIPSLLDDPDLFGAGLHQLMRGGFLDVHVDFNRHPTTQHERRLNLILYMNKGWQPEWEGYLELWDLPKRRLLDRVAPSFNRAVLFETNEHSYHGHPRPLNCPEHVTRKSLAVYYYTQEPASTRSSLARKPLFCQTMGPRGYLKTMRSALETVSERASRRGLPTIARALLRRAGLYLGTERQE